MANPMRLSEPNEAEMALSEQESAGRNTENLMPVWKILIAIYFREEPHHERFVLVKLRLRKNEKATYYSIPDTAIIEYKEQRNLSDSPRRTRIDRAGSVRVVLQ